MYLGDKVRPSFWCDEEDEVEQKTVMVGGCVGGVIIRGEIFGVKEEYARHLAPGEYYAPFSEFIESRKLEHVLRTITEEPTGGDMLVMMPFGIHSLRGCRMQELGDGKEAIVVTAERTYTSPYVFRDTHIVSPEIETWPDGYCYLKGVKSARRAVAASVLGALAPSDDVSRYIDEPLPVAWAGVRLHAVGSRQGEGRFEVPAAVIVPGEVPDLSVRGCKVGAVGCANLDPGSDLCQSCSATLGVGIDYAAVLPDCNDGKDSGVPSREKLKVKKKLFGAGSTDPPESDILYFQELGKHGKDFATDCGGSVPVASSAHNRLACAVLHKCNGGEKKLSFSSDSWAFELEPGERVSCRKDGEILIVEAVFRPMLLVLHKGWSFDYHGSRDWVAVRVFDKLAFVRFQHVRLKFGTFDYVATALRKTEARLFYRGFKRDVCGAKAYGVRPLALDDPVLENVDLTVGSVFHAADGNFGVPVGCYGTAIVPEPGKPRTIFSIVGGRLTLCGFSVMVSPLAADFVRVASGEGASLLVAVVDDEYTIDDGGPSPDISMSGSDCDY